MNIQGTSKFENFEKHVKTNEHVRFLGRLRPFKGRQQETLLGTPGG